MSVFEVLFDISRLSWAFLTYRYDSTIVEKFPQREPSALVACS